MEYEIGFYEENPMNLLRLVPALLQWVLPVARGEEVESLRTTL